MNFYKMVRPLLFMLPTEAAHHFTLAAANFLYRLHLLKQKQTNVKNTVNVMGLNFPNRIGLAAGLDKNADYVDALSCLGFGFIEVGTITPRPQTGNPLPRLFRLVEDECLINRMGFNNKGVAHMVGKLKTMKYRGILGVNMGKNADTPLENAADDYLTVMRAVYPYASYVVVNLSSPNTPGLRELQHGEYLDHLLMTLKQAQKELSQQYQRHVPLVVKVAPDLTHDQIKEMAAAFIKHQIEGVIATNTTLTREGLKNQIRANEAGGLSGKVLKPLADTILWQLNQSLAGKIPLIGVGGIANVSDAQEKFAKGAALIQVYTGLVFEGPELIEKLINYTN